MGKAVSVGLACLSVLGCSTGRDITHEAYKVFMSQPRTFNTIKISGVDEWSLSGTNMTIAFQAPLTPLSALPKDPGIVSELVNGLVRIGTVYGATVVGLELADSPRVVTQPEPLVVRPEVINAGGQ
jgi:hypothetical protein